MIAEKKFKVELETLEPFRVGAPKDPRSGIENPVTVLGGRAVVPGSTLKGALRAQIEQFLIDTYYDSKAGRWQPDKLAFQPCIPATSLSKDEEMLIRSGRYRTGGSCHYPCRHRDERQAAKGGEVGPERHSICPACYFLGAAGLPGFVHVPFLYSDITPDDLYSSRIDRATGTVKEGTNRPYQLIRQGVVFSGELIVIAEDSLTQRKLGQPRQLGDDTLGDVWLQKEPLAPDELVKKFVIERLKAIASLGGYKSKGFGRVKVRVVPA